MMSPSFKLILITMGADVGVMVGVGVGVGVEVRVGVGVEVGVKVGVGVGVSVGVGVGGEMNSTTEQDVIAMQRIKMDKRDSR